MKHVLSPDVDLGNFRPDDPVAGIRLGTEVLMVEVPDDRAALVVGSLIALRTREIQLYPYQLQPPAAV